MSSGLSSNFQDRQVQMETGELKEFAFTATPSIQQGGGLFQLRITVSAGDATKYVTSVITTGEMLTDPARSAAWITANTTNQSIISSVNSALNAWNTDNSQSPYGTNTQGYQDLNNALANARLNANQPGNPPGTQTCTPQVKECGGGMLFECNSSGTGWVSSLCDFGCSNDTLACKAEGPGNGDVTILLVALGIVAAVAVVLVLAFFMRGRKGSIEKQLNESWEN
jgi:hypothetical protein